MRILSLQKTPLITGLIIAGLIFISESTWAGENLCNTLDNDPDKCNNSQTYDTDPTVRNKICLFRCEHFPNAKKDPDQKNPHLCHKMTDPKDRPQVCWNLNDPNKPKDVTEKSWGPPRDPSKPAAEPKKAIKTFENPAKEEESSKTSVEEPYSPKPWEHKR